MTHAKVFFVSVSDNGFGGFWTKAKIEKKKQQRRLTMGFALVKKQQQFGNKCIQS